MVDFLVLAALVGAAIWAIGQPTVRQQLKTLVRSTPKHNLATAPETERVCITGRAYAQGPQGPALYAPITGRPCLMYIVTVEQLESETSTMWRQIIFESNGVPFTLIDQSGRAFIDPTVAHTLLKLDREGQSGPFAPVDPSKEALLTRHGYTSTSWMFHAKLRYREAVVDVGETVVVLGFGVREPDPDGTPTGGYRTAMPLRMRFTGTATYPLVISDDPTMTLQAQQQLPTPT